MNIVADGTIFGAFAGASPKYILLDIGKVGSNFAKCKLEVIATLNASYMGAGASGGTNDNSVYINNLPSIWAESGFPTTSQAAMLVDSGFCFGVSTFNGTNGPVTFSDGTAVNRYGNFNAPTDGGLYLNMSPSMADLTGTYTSEIYNVGIYVQAEFAGRGTLGIFFTNTSEVYFFHNVAFNAGFGPVGKGLRQVNVSAYCSPLKIYLLRSKLSTVSGSVEDAAGAIAPNCKIFMFRRSDGRLLGNTISDSNGNYTMNTHALSGDSVFMVCLDDDNAPDFEGIIYDRVTI